MHVNARPAVIEKTWFLTDMVVKEWKAHKNVWRWITQGGSEDKNDMNQICANRICPPLVRGPPTRGTFLRHCPWHAKSKKVNRNARKSKEFFNAFVFFHSVFADCDSIFQITIVYKISDLKVFVYFLIYGWNYLVSLAKKLISNHY